MSDSEHGCITTGFITVAVIVFLVLFARHITTEKSREEYPIVVKTTTLIQNEHGIANRTLVTTVDEKQYILEAPTQLEKNSNAILLIVHTKGDGIVRYIVQNGSKYSIDDN